jgi:hypothetical protein
MTDFCPKLKNGSLHCEEEYLWALLYLVCQDIIETSQRAPLLTPKRAFL